VKHEGNLEVTKDNINYAKTLTSVTGALYVGAECEFPLLASTGTLYVHAECEFPLLASAGALYVRAECEFPLLASAYGEKGKLIGFIKNGYGLWLGDNGLYCCGCKKLNKQDALSRWGAMSDPLAQELVEMINQIREL